MSLNTLVIGDTEYALSKAYCDGARALREGVPYNSNPNYGSSSQAHEDWSAGHVNESAGEHFRFGQDLLQVPHNSLRFEEDPAVTRDAHGEVCLVWYETKIHEGGH